MKIINQLYLHHLQTTTLMKDIKKERNHKSYLYVHALAQESKCALNKIQIKQPSGVNFMDFKRTLLIFNNSEV